MEYKYIVVGLGNPGDKFKRTRHNAGFLVIDKVAEEFGPVSFESFKKDAEFGRAEIANNSILLVRPLSFMNKSGESLRRFLDYRDLSAEEVLNKLIVISDDADQLEGHVKIVRDRGTGGHNGLEDIKEHLGTMNFIRIKIGIRPKGNMSKSETFVLTPFGEKNPIQQSISRTPQILECLVTKGLANCQSLYNSREVVHEP